MRLSAFGVDHGVIAKSDALGTRESILAIAHGRGEHVDNPSRYCPTCSRGAYHSVRPAVKAAVESAVKVPK